MTSSDSRRDDLRDEMQALLDKLFSNLKKNGFQFARQDFMCSMGCGLQEIVNISEKREAAGKEPITRWAFYHEQDAAMVKYGDVHIAYGDAVEQGEDVRQAALAAGLCVIWDGDILSRVEVMHPDAVEHRVKNLQYIISINAERITSGQAEEPWRVAEWVAKDKARLESLTEPTCGESSGA